MRSAHDSGTQSHEHERQAAAQAFQQERAHQQHLLQAEHKAALQVMQQERYFKRTSFLLLQATAKVCTSGLLLCLSTYVEPADLRSVHTPVKSCFESLQYASCTSILAHIEVHLRLD